MLVWNDNPPQKLEQLALSLKKKKEQLAWDASIKG